MSIENELNLSNSTTPSVLLYKLFFSFKNICLGAELLSLFDGIRMIFKVFHFLKMIPIFVEPVDNFVTKYEKNISGYNPSSIYSWSISHILEHEFFCLGCLG